MQVAFEVVKPEQVDRVRVRHVDDDVAARTPGRWRDGHLELALVELPRRRAYFLLGETVGTIGLTRDGGLPRAGACGVGDRQIVVEGDPELDDAEEEERQHGQNDGELDHRLSAFVSQLMRLVRHFLWRRW